MKLKLSVVLILGLVGLLAYQAIAKIKVFSSAYLYGYPAMIMQQTEKVMLSGEASANQLIHNTNFPDHLFRNVVRPNVDTLYTIAWFNLSEEPQILSVPDMGDRYYISPFMDAWTNVFASVGTRTTGNKAGNYLLAGPNWKGTTPDNVTLITAPTNQVWMIQRLQVKGPDDVATVTELQQQFSLASLSQWQQGQSHPALVGSLSKGNAESNPYLTIDKMTADHYFLALSALLAQQNTAAADQEAVALLASIGVTPGDYNPGKQGWLGKLLANRALDITRDKIKQQLASRRSLDNGWAIFREDIGNYGTNYRFRAGVAIMGLGALPPEDALYPMATADIDGQTLSGQHRYKIHFEPGQTPPVDAFWSLTMYDEEGFLVESAINRYAINDRDTLTYNDDGSLDLLLQHTAPQDNASNWLPTPAQNFVVTLRLYAPKPAATNGSWPLPRIIKQ